MSYCISSFHYLQDTLQDEIHLFKIFKRAPPQEAICITKDQEVDKGHTTQESPQVPTMGEITDKIIEYAVKHPVKFVAMASFSVLAAIPTAIFFAYAVATVIASLVGALLLQLVLLLVGVSSLAFVLLFVTCIATCATSVFMAMYYSYLAVNATRKKAFKIGRESHIWPLSSSSSLPSGSDPTQISQTEQTDELFDKRKPELDLGFTQLSHSFVSTLPAETPLITHDFVRTALITLMLVFTICIMSLMVLTSAYLVVNFT